MGRRSNCALNIYLNFKFFLTAVLFFYLLSCVELLLQTPNSKIMKKNFNKSGRFIRVILGISLLVLAFTDFFADDLVQKIAIGVSIFLILTALIYFCPIYYFLGIDTFKSGKKPKMY